METRRLGHWYTAHRYPEVSFTYSSGYLADSSFRRWSMRISQVSMRQVLSSLFQRIIVSCSKRFLLIAYPPWVAIVPASNLRMHDSGFTRGYDTFHYRENSSLEAGACAPFFGTGMAFKREITDFSSACSMRTIRSS